MLWTEFIRRSPDADGMNAKRQCAKTGHPPYIRDSEGGDGKIAGCRCGWVRLETALEPVPCCMNWSDYPEAIFLEH